MHQTHTHEQFLHWILWKIFERPGWKCMAWYGTVRHGLAWSMVSSSKRDGVNFMQISCNIQPRQQNVANDFLINRHWVWGFSTAAKCVATCDRQLQRLPRTGRQGQVGVELRLIDLKMHLMFIFIYRKVLPPQAETCERSPIDVRLTSWQTDKLWQWGRGRKNSRSWT